MTPVNFAAYVRKKTKTNSTTFPDADMLIYMNTWKDEIAGMIEDIVDEDYFGAPQTADLVNGQREYPLPQDAPGKIKKVEAVLDPTYLNSSNLPVWVDLRKFDLSQLSQLSQNLVAGDVNNGEFSVNPTTDEATITSFFGNRQGQAAFMIYRNSLWIFSGTLANFTSPNNYLKLWSYQWPADITSLAGTADLSVDPDNVDAGIPRQIHKVWADKVILEKKQDSDREYQPNDYENELDTILHDRIMSLTQVDKDESYTATQPEAGHIYHDGFDL